MDLRDLNPAVDGSLASHQFHRHPHHHRSPPTAITDLHVTIHQQPEHHKRNKIMSTATLTWTPPTARADGSALDPSAIASAAIYDSLSPTPATPIGSVTGAIGTFTTGPLAAGVHNFTVTTTDTNGDVSAPSNSASGTVALAAPAAITNLAVIINP
jgi:hypothetical protein